MSGQEIAEKPISVVLTELSARNGEGVNVRLGDVVDMIGSRGHGIAIVLLALPDTIPAPIPGLSGILGIPLFFISLHLAIFGETGRLPKRAERVAVPGRFLTLLARYGAPVLRRAERVTGPRFLAIAGRERLVGLFCVLWSLVLWLPIPFLNGPPATLLVLMAWGLIQRDGLFVGLGLVGSFALIAASVLLGDVFVDLLIQPDPV
ncbi:exopolysaccharide biosynthesis protein [Jannaschia aquimarina]|uniref:Exopolysaccharide synthesis, ExoD n=1 Tax=Jannaschia aquimarina TaxID=935700 RepID=A0A0D1D2L2_9RHOB|nr:exopolysaccharide biosynthesis protein [Jannaschia aquimarina]KIT14313.1 Exopolysaccharide synthesis, ExoD [Jannaschia aquimarina]SNS85849.1 Uncharacterized conserved protein [Jannaschia aquimarina]